MVNVNHSNIFPCCVFDRFIGGVRLYKVWDSYVENVLLYYWHLFPDPDTYLHRNPSCAAHAVCNPPVFTLTNIFPVALCYAYSCFGVLPAFVSLAARPSSTRPRFVWFARFQPLVEDCLVGLVVKASATRAEDPRFESRLRRDFFGVESYQWLRNWHSSGYPARRLAL